MATLTRVTLDQLGQASSLAKVSCQAFNQLLDTPGTNLNVMVRSNRVVVVSADHMPSVQAAFADLADKVKYDRLRFGAGDMGSIWCDFEGRDGDTWRAALNPHRPEPPYSYQLCLSKVRVNM